jgi:hypothetical protein
LGFPTKILYATFSPTHATCPAHLSLLYMITWILFGEEYRAQSFFVYSKYCDKITQHSVAFCNDDNRMFSVVTGTSRETVVVYTVVVCRLRPIDSVQWRQ